MKTKKTLNLLGGWSNLSRAIEIALVGGHTITVVFDSDYEQGWDDYKTLKDFANEVGFFKNFTEDGDLYVELVKPDIYPAEGSLFESLDTVKARVDKAIKWELKSNFLNDACRSLLRTATQRFELSFKEHGTIRYVAGSIARLDGSDEVRLEHLAEAVSYRFNKRGMHFNAEAGTVNIGNSIKINKGPIEASEIEAAVNYLNSIKTF